MPKKDIEWRINKKSQEKEKKYSLESFFKDSIFSFHQDLESYRPTPLIELKELSLKYNISNILVKDESMRIGTGAFKALGASWAIYSYINNNPGKHTFCTATDGNHGRSVAWSSRIFKQNAIVFMPKGSALARIESIKREGAQVIIVDGDYDLTVETAQKVASENDYVLIQDTAWDGYTDIPQTIGAGYITMLQEIEIQLKKMSHNMPDIVILQSGVGTWAASMILYLSLTNSENPPRFIIVEPYESDCIMESSKNNTLSKTKKSQKTIMAGLNCGTPSSLAWEIISDLADAYISIPDRYAEKGMRALAKPGKGMKAIDSCESGAAGMAAFLAIVESGELSEFKNELNISKDTSFLIFNTEGITDPEMYAKIVGKSIISKG